MSPRATTPNSALPLAVEPQGRSKTPALPPPALECPAGAVARGPPPCPCSRLPRRSPGFDEVPTGHLPRRCLWLDADAAAAQPYLAAPAALAGARVLAARAVDSRLPAPTRRSWQSGWQRTVHRGSADPPRTAVQHLSTPIAERADVPCAAWVSECTGQRRTCTAQSTPCVCGVTRGVSCPLPRTLALSHVPAQPPQRPCRLPAPPCRPCRIAQAAAARRVATHPPLFSPRTVGRPGQGVDSTALRRTSAATHNEPCGTRTTEGDARCRRITPSVLARSIAL